MDRRLGHTANMPLNEDIIYRDPLAWLDGNSRVHIVHKTSGIEKERFEGTNACARTLTNISLNR